MKYIIILWFLSFTCNAQQIVIIENSIGVVTLGHITKSDKITLYNMDGTPWYEFNIFNGIDDSFKLNENIEPYVYDIDYFDISFLCVEKDNSFHTIVINKEKKLYKKLKIIDSTLVFKFWCDYVIDQDAIGFMPETNKIKSKPMDNSEELEFNPDYTYKPVEINKDWLKISWQPDEGIKANFGWINWKKDDKLLIYFLKD